MIWLWLILSTWASENCTLGGESISLYNGSTTAGKTGLAICKDEKGDIKRTITFKNGQQIGPMTSVDYDGAKHEFTLNEKGNHHGLERTYSPKGVLIQERTLNNSTTVGLARLWWPNGKKQSAYFNDENGRPLSSIEWNKDGRLTDLRCDTDSHFEEDKEYCGFKKDSVIEFPATAFEKAQTHTYRKGLKINVTVWQEYKKPLKQQILNDNKISFKEFFPTGELKLENEQLWKGRGKPPVILWEKEFFMNGKMKIHNVYENGEKKHKKEFYDDGKLKSEGDYMPGRYRDIPIGLESHFSEKGTPTFEYQYNKEGQLDGLSKIYDEAGKLRIQTTFQNGERLREIEYSETGEVIRNDEYLPDGSRKNLAN